MKIQNLTPEFVEFIPEKVEEGRLYISEKYRTAVHKCCCGCGREVVTPLTPADWQVRRNGNQVSLWPSIGNWSFPCRSHYIIRNNCVVEAGGMTNRQIQNVKARDRADKKSWITQVNRNKAAHIAEPDAQQQAELDNIGLLKRLLYWWRSL
jgi:hypothetical protein